MKALHFFASAVAIAMLSACSSSDEPAADASATGGETGYLAVNLVNANNGGRADDPTEADFVDGTDDENKINNCRLYFFDNSGNAVTVYSSAVGGANTRNYIELDLDNIDTNTETGDFNVEKILGATVVLKSDETSPFPTQVMAVANYDKDADIWKEARLARDQLTGEIQAMSFEGGYPMASSVYSNGTNIVYSTPILDKIANSEADAINNPVDIYIERAVARVDLVKRASTNWADYTLEDHSDISVDILGWSVVNYPEYYYVVKHLEENWVTNAPFTGWNSADLYRSFWAYSPDSSGDKFHATFDELTKDCDVAKVPSDTEQKHLYVTENTYDHAATGTELDVNAQVIILCQLKKNGTKFEYFHYMGRDLESEDDVIKAIAATFKGKYYIKTTDQGRNIYADLTTNLFNLKTPTELKKVNKSYGLLDYQVVAQLNNEATGKVIVNGNNDDATTVTFDEVNADLAKYPAEIAKDGYVYYFADIKHLGNKIGVVRNHVYQIEVESFKGLGTPVYDPTQIIIPTNVVDAETYVAARIKVHSWRIVNNKYNFGN